ncbi:class I SAM-dependent methyltransferase [Micromonospora sp. C51]|uniref:class I SAM-dependent methyltransferase n=1 Tax=Micromonospora sp. C51 TaxID=2824879 RepID=UPI001B36008D|nr:class I SAM-dependent methyltransferase [Micromonospora sp. C51]MBQ1047864.1 class I SAM-dependent methyltransferase [Micromonospora sp. C51]
MNDPFHGPWPHPGPESRWTRPSDFCPHPQWWTASDAYSTEVEVTELVAAFVRALQPEYVVETGTCWGQTAEAVGRALATNGHGHLDSLEIDPVKVAHSRTRCDGLPVTVVARPSLEFTPAAPIGFAWFDSLLELRVPEFERYRPWLAAGAIVGFHDTAPHMGYGHQVDGIAGVRPIRLRTPRGVTFCEVL